MQTASNNFGFSRISRIHAVAMEALPEAVRSRASALCVQECDPYLTWELITPSEVMLEKSIIC